MAETAPAAAPVVDAQTAEIIKALHTPPMQYDPYAGATEAAAAKEAPVAAEAGLEAPAYSSASFPQSARAAAQDISEFEAPETPPRGFDPINFPDIKYPTIAEILQKYALELSPSVKEARARMLEALTKVKATAASPITPKAK